MSSLTTIPARSGAHAYLKAGAKIKVINTHGNQVIDTWAFTTDPSISPPQHLSTTQTRTFNLKLSLLVGDIIRTNTRQPMLKLIEDTTPGVHDMVFAACDEYRYQQLGVEGFHDSCANNLRTELRKIGMETGRGQEWIPDPLNLFMNVPVEKLEGGKGGKVGLVEPISQKGQYVILQAEVDCLVIMSACPNDLAPTNAFKTVEAHFEVL
ncbi:MAG: hypothetical protein Q9160_001873 [Pyrenula sp. 1 TL-2023]